MDMEHLQLPKGFQPLENQVAGHTFQTNSLGLLQDAATGTVLKPLGKPDCGERELRFYESLQQKKGEAEEKTNLVLQQLRPLVPQFHRKLQLLVNGREHTFLQLEDITYGLRKPCIMDIKIGRRTWDPLASEEKREVEEQKYVRCKQVLGLCVPGFQMYPLKTTGVDSTRHNKSNGDNELSVLRYGKEYGKQLDADGFRATIALFLNAQPPPAGVGVYEPLVRELLRQLYAIREWFQSQRILHFYASSLLVAYDAESLQAHIQRSSTSSPVAGIVNGDAQKEAVDGPLQDAARWIKLKMIDFAHVFPTDAESGSLDTNYLFGLQNLIAIIEDLLLVR